jgi:hypothetical protein
MGHLDDYEAGRAMIDGVYCYLPDEGPGVAYFDDATMAWWFSLEREVAILGRMAGEHDAYSRWCNEHPGVELAGRAGSEE